MAEAQHAPKGGRFKLLFVTALVVGLLTAVGYLAGQLNTHRYYLVKNLRQLEVHRGAQVPFMTRSFVPRSDDERTAYAPIFVGPRYQGPRRQSFDDRDALDRGIFAIVAERLKKELYSGRLPNLERVDAAMKRIHALSGLGDQERGKLRGLEGDYAYMKAKEIIETLPEQLRRARRLCDQAEDQGSDRLGDPRALAAQVARWLNAISQAGLTAPLPASTAPGPAAPQAPAVPAAPAPEEARPDPAAPASPVQPLAPRAPTPPKADGQQPI